MPDIASVLKTEIARIARKEIKQQTQPLKRAAGGYRHEIAALKRRIRDLENELRRLGDSKPAANRASEEGPEVNRRFSAKGLAALRQRLGLSGAQLAQLIGASALSVYKWENGKARPRTKYLEAIAAVRGLGKREAEARLRALQ